MASPKAPPAVLEDFYNVKQATVRLNLATEDPADLSGQRWLRDGCNRPEDGSKGPRFPHHRLAGQLRFSDTDLAEIAALHRNVRNTRTGNQTGRPRRRTTARTTVTRKAAAPKQPARAAA
jgi:hypothetical protein